MQCQNLFRHCLKQYYLSSLQSFCGNKRVCITVHAFAYFPKMLSDDVSMRGQKEDGKARTSPQFLSQSESDPEPKRVWPLAFLCRLVGRAICPISDGCIHRGRAWQARRRSAGKKTPLVARAGASASPMNLSFVFAPLSVRPSAPPRILISVSPDYYYYFFPPSPTLLSLYKCQKDRETVSQVGDVRRMTATTRLILVSQARTTSEQSKNSLSRAMPSKAY